MNSDNLIFIIPVYNDFLSLKKLLSEINQIYSNAHILIIDDGSNETETIDNQVLGKNCKIKILTLKRNVGHQFAIAVGLNYILSHINKDSKIIIMDSDGEDSPHSVEILLNSFNNNNIDAAVAERKNRSNTLIFKIFYILYKYIFKILTGKKITFGNFIALNQKSIIRLTTMNELPIHTAATLLSSGLKIKYCPLDRNNRYFGKSKMNFVSLVLHGMRALMIFSESIIVRIGIICFILGVLSIILIFIVIMLKILGFATPGWFSTALGLLLIIFLQTGALTLMSLLLTGLLKERIISTKSDILYLIK